MVADQWCITLISFNDYKHAILSKNGRTWDELIDSDLIIGGIDFTGDVLSVNLHFMEFRCQLIQEQVQLCDGSPAARDVSV
jgi:hypothetical protein